MGVDGSAAGPGAVLSHHDAAALHGMRKPLESTKASVSTPSAARGTPRLWVYGRRRLIAALEAHEQRGASLTRSELEERFLDLTIDARLPPPELNVRAAGHHVDALWRDQRLVVELDGWAHHKERAAAAWDREKTNRLQAAGYRVLRFMHGDLVRRPDEVAAAIRGLLAR